MESRNVIITWIAVTVAVMFAFSFAVARLASECSGMALCMIMFFIVNPIYSVILGFRCGRNIRQMWNLPLVSTNHELDITPLSTFGCRCDYIVA